jgi:hypothetical protein
MEALGIDNLQKIGKVLEVGFKEENGLLGFGESNVYQKVMSR